MSKSRPSRAAGALRAPKRRALRAPQTAKLLPGRPFPSYYWNERTNETSWERPAGPADAEAPAAAAGAPAAAAEEASLDAGNGGRERRGARGASSGRVVGALQTEGSGDSSKEKENAENKQKEFASTKSLVENQGTFLVHFSRKVNGELVAVIISSRENDQVQKDGR